MAIVLRRKDLTKEKEKLIVSLLNIERTVTSVTFFNGRPTKVESPFPFYNVTTDLVYVPFAFGNRLLGYFPHDKKEYHKINVKFTGTLRPRQEKKIKKIDALFDKNRAVTLMAHTGFGKTRLANFYISKFGLLTVVLVPSSMLMIQWTMAIKEILNDVKVGTVGEDYRNEEYGKDHPDVLVCMPDRWSYINPEVRQKLGFVIIDEAHTYCAEKRSQTLLNFSPRFILALSASPLRSDNSYGVMTSLCGVERVRARYQNPVSVWSFNTGIYFETIKNGRNQTNWSSTIKNITEDENRNLLITDLVNYIVTSLGRKPLLMCDRKEHVKTLVDLIKGIGISCDFLMENKNTYEESQVLVGIISKIGTGFDEQYACPEFSGNRLDTVVYVTSIKNINGLIQYGGRAFRSEKPMIIHIVDENPILESHWKKAQKYYLSKEYLKNVEIDFISPSDIWKEE